MDWGFSLEDSMLNRLERLDLDCCGRGMGPPTAAALAHPSTSSHHPAPSLSALVRGLCHRVFAFSSWMLGDEGGLPFRGRPVA